MDLWTQFETIERGVLACAWAALGLSFVLALWAVRPAHIVTQFGARKLRRLPERTHVLSFYSIATHNRDDYVRAFHDKSDRELQDELLRAIHGKSIKARQKFTDLLRAAACLAVSVGAIFLLAVLVLIELLS